MLNFTKTVSRSITGTAQQIDIKLMHPLEKFRYNLLEFIFMKEFNFLTHDLKHRKFESGGFCSAKHSKSQTLPRDLKATIGKCLCFPTKRLLESDERQVN